MSVTASHGAPICPNCRARVDARRGPTAMCLSCGAPLGNYSAAAPVGSNGLWLVFGLVSFFALFCVGVILFLVLRTAPTSTPVATVTVVTESTAAPSSASSASASASTTVSAAPLSDAEKDQLDGTYMCGMDDTPNFPCRVSNGILEKLGGSQRFKGPISKQPGGNLTFSGTFFCPFGDCTHPVACTFVRQAPGKYLGKFGPNSIPGGGPGGEHVALVKVR